MAKALKWLKVYRGIRTMWCWYNFDKVSWFSCIRLRLKQIDTLGYGRQRVSYIPLTSHILCFFQDEVGCLASLTRSAATINVIVSCEDLSRLPTIYL